jgi:hypothetical protein
LMARMSNGIQEFGNSAIQELLSSRKSSPPPP